MCDPVSATMAAVSIASTAASLYAQDQQAGAQKKYQEKMADANNAMAAANNASALAAYDQDSHQQNLRIQQEREAASEEMQDIQREALEKRGQAVASSHSVADALMRDFSRQEARYKDSVRHNFDMTALQIEGQKTASQAKAQDRINQASSYVASPIDQPDYLGAGLQIAGGALDAYKYHVKNTPSETKTP